MQTQKININNPMYKKPLILSVERISGVNNETFYNKNIGGAPLKDIINQNKFNLISSLFSNYTKIVQEIELLKISLKYTKQTNISDEITSLALKRPTEPNQRGKSNVRDVSKKTENIALSVEDNLNHECAKYENRIALLENVKKQIDFYISSLDKLNAYIFNMKFIQNKKNSEIAINQLDITKAIHRNTVNNKVKQITIRFLDITPLSEVQIKQVLEKM